MGFLSWFFGHPKKKSDKYINLAGQGFFSAKVVGESHYRGNLSRICGGYTEDGVENFQMASLVYEDDNRYDKNAIKVEISGKIVGYLSRSDALNYRETMRLKGHAGLIANCRAKISGGWDRGNNDIGDFGVTLDLPNEFIESFKCNPVINENNDQPIKNNVLLFYIDDVQSDELIECRLGDNVKFWWPKNEPFKIYIFRPRSVGGNGRIGFVPREFIHIITSHINKGMEYKTEIMELKKNKCKIKCYLFSKEESESHKVQ